MKATVKRTSGYKLCGPAFSSQLTTGLSYTTMNSWNEGFNMSIKHDMTYKCLHNFAENLQFVY